MHPAGNCRTSGLACSEVVMHFDMVCCNSSQVYPAEVREAVTSCLDPCFSWDAMVATFATIEAGIGRHAPALQGLMWGDMLFVKQAVKLQDGLVVSAFGCAFVLRGEKITNRHNTRMVVVDVSGEDHIMDELLLMPSQQLLNLAMLMGVVNEGDLCNTPVGKALPMCNESKDWCGREIGRWGCHDAGLFRRC